MFFAVSAVKLLHSIMSNRELQWLVLFFFWTRSVARKTGKCNASLADSTDMEALVIPALFARQNLLCGASA